ncbi:MAG: hypothetical protein ABI895_22820 [Deltaproteobacteria bacterium]
MLPPAVLLVFVLSPDAAEPTTPSFQTAAREVLGPRAAVRVEALTEALPDAAALERGGSAAGIIELIWSSTRESVLLHCYIASQARWVDRTVHFGSDDLEVERGRLLGFAVASMFSNAPSFEQTAPGLPQSREPGAAPKLSSRPARVEPPSGTAEGRSVPAGSTPGTVPVATANTGRRALEFSAVAIPDFGGSLSPEFGASAALRRALAGPLWLRGELSGRLGEIPTAQANLRRLLAGVGIEWEVLPAPAPMRIGLRADVLGSWIQVAHLSSDDVERVHQQRWLVGSDALATVGYGISPSALICAGVGVEAMFGRTYVYTHGVEVAVVPILRSRLDLGFRSDF